jgi:hypothetical protein
MQCSAPRDGLDTIKVPQALGVGVRGVRGTAADQRAALTMQNPQEGLRLRW